MGSTEGDIGIEKEEMVDADNFNMDENLIIKKLDGIDDKVSKLLIWKATLDERCGNHRKETNGMHKTLYKNPGLVSKVQKLENCKDTLKKSQSRWSDFWMYILKALVVVAVVSFIGLMVKVLGIITLFNGAK